MKEIKQFKLYTDEIELVISTIAPAPYYHTKLYECYGQYFIIIKDEGPEFSDPPVYSLWAVRNHYETDIERIFTSNVTELEQLVVENGLYFSEGKKSWDDAVEKSKLAIEALYSKKN